MGNMYGVGSQSAQVGAALRVKPWRRLLVAALPALLVLSACGKKEDAPKPAEPTQSKPAASAADTVGKKVLRIAFVVGETGFDPVKVHDLYSSTVNDGIFEKLLAYDYLASPPKLVPGLAEEMPKIEDEGKTYTFKIRKGVYFAPDEKFKGQKRELTAQDVVYSLMRHMDEKNRPVWKFLIEGKIKGLDELAAEAKKTGKFNYDAKVEGLEVVDKHTLKLKLKVTDYNFGYILAHTPFGIVAREVIEGYEDTNAHPVGTNAYMLTSWQRRSKMVLEKNPNFRGAKWDFAPSSDPIDAQLIAEMKGKSLPLIDRVEISVIEEEQARWLAFQNGELDDVSLPGNFAPIALPGGKISAELAAKGVRVQTQLDPEVTYTYFNMKDPVWGGYSVDKIALRRAVAMSYNVAEEIDVIRKGQAVRAEYIVPPGVAGHNVGHKSSIQYDVDTANKLLDKFGYKKGADGYRTLPDGKALVFKYNSDPSSISREFDELWKKSLDRVGIKFEAEKEKFADALKREKQCQLVTRGAAWIADYPDGDNFMMLLYGPNTGESNNGCYQSAKYDALYKKTTMLPDGPERTAIYAEMHKVFEADTPWLLHTTRKRNQMIYPWLKGYKKHPILHAEWMYLDIEGRK
jgi:oligopeptide transport system substrate-binding protein